MPQTACFREIFQPNSPVYASLQFQPIQNKIGGFIASDRGRPYVPYCGAIIDPVTLTLLIPDTIVNNKLNIIVFKDYFDAVRQASLNFYFDLVGNTTIDPNSPYAGYLAKNTSDIASAIYGRYRQLYTIVWNFWQSANVLWTAEQFQNALNGLVEIIKQQADKSLYIPNAEYNFNAGNAFTVSWTAYKAMSPDLRGFLTVEIQQ